mmetsp:Transcript_36648/g.43798  ORF Transcript_36648/g.43798 Transcript_36648/m.43798 type:complete len:226 (-) Transcript_36648:49-726(-)
MDIPKVQTNLIKTNHGQMLIIKLVQNLIRGVMYLLPFTLNNILHRNHKRGHYWFVIRNIQLTAAVSSLLNMRWNLRPPQNTITPGRSPYFLIRSLIIHICPWLILIGWLKIKLPLLKSVKRPSGHTLRIQLIIFPQNIQIIPLRHHQHIIGTNRLIHTIIQITHPKRHIMILNPNTTTTIRPLLQRTIPYKLPHRFITNPKQSLRKHIPKIRIPPGHILTMCRQM